MQKLKTVVFFGTDNFSLASLKALHEAGYKIAAVVTKPDSKSGRGQKITQSVIKQFAIQNNIPVWQPVRASDIKSDILALGEEVVGVLSSYGKIIPQETIDLFKPGIINVHPSLLPKYRGPTPIESAIENGDKETGVSIMLLSSKMDAGPIYKQATYDLNGTETQPELYEKLAELGAKTLLEVLPKIIEGKLSSSPQDETAATYSRLLSKADQLIKPSEIDAKTAEKLVRAHLVYPKTKISLKDSQIIITKAHVSESAELPTDIKFKDGKYLSVDNLIAPSGRAMSAKAFCNGYLK